MSVSQDQLEQERVARQAAIKKALAPATAEEPPDWGSEHSEQGATKAAPTATVESTPPVYGQRLRPWEVFVKNRPVQFRPLTRTEALEENEREFMRRQFEQDKAHESKVQAAMKEAKREQADMDKRRAHEQQTRRREYGKERFIPLDEARRRNLLSTPADADSWSTPNNPDGLFCGGR